MISITNIITSNLTGCFVGCFVLVGDVFFFQPNIELAVELNIFWSHDPDPLHKPSIIDPNNIFQTQFRLGCQIAWRIQAGLEVNKFCHDVAGYLFATPKFPALICISLSIIPVIPSIVKICCLVSCSIYWSCHIFPRWALHPIENCLLSQSW